MSSPHIIDCLMTALDFRPAKTAAIFSIKCIWNLFARSNDKFFTMKTKDLLIGCQCHKRIQYSLQLQRILWLTDKYPLKETII